MNRREDKKNQLKQDARRYPEDAVKTDVGFRTAEISD